MLKAVAQNLVLVVGLVVAAAGSGWLASAFVSSRGALGPGLFQAESFGAALGASIGALAISTVAAVIVGRVTNTAVGLFVLGGGLFGLAWRLETLREIVFTTDWPGSVSALALETVVWTVLVGGATFVVFKLAGPLQDVEPDEEGRRPHPLLSKDAATMFGAGLLVLPLIFLVAQTSTKGQVLGAVFCGAMAVGLFGRLLAPHVQPMVLFVAPIFFGAIGYFVGTMMLDTPLDAAWVRGEVPAFLAVMPIDYAAGSLMGVAVGLGWARSFLHHEEGDAAEAAPSPG